MRFRRRVKLFPGVRLNFSLSGISTTIGVPGLSVNIGKRGTYLNTGIPGTGLYSRQKIGGRRKYRAHSQQKFTAFNPPIPTTPEPITPDMHQEIAVGVIQSKQAEVTTTEGLRELKQLLLECYDLRNQLESAVKTAKRWLSYSKALWILSRFLLVGFLIPTFSRYRDRRRADYEETQDQLEGCFVEIEMSVERGLNENYDAVVDAYKGLLACEKIWDVTSMTTRRPVKFGFKDIDIIRSQYNALHFENANGGDLYIYPAFIAIVDSQRKFGLLDIDEVTFKFTTQNFVEKETVPKDALVSDHVRVRANADGRHIPICKYGYMTISSKTGLNEAYAFSSHRKAEKFAVAMRKYQDLIRKAGSVGQPKITPPRS
jgi:hypothetical protein